MRAPDRLHHPLHGETRFLHQIAFLTHRVVRRCDLLQHTGKTGDKYSADGERYEEFNER